MIEINLFYKQKFLLDTLINGTANEILYGGAAGGGKSFLLRALAIILSIEVPGIQVFLFRRKVKDLKKTHLDGPKSFRSILDPYVKENLVSINTSDSTITFVNQSQISLCHCQHEKDLENYLSAEFHALLVDESTTFTQKMIRFLRSRVRTGGFDIPEKFQKALPCIVYATNPKGASHSYFKRSFVDAYTAMKPFKAPADDGGMTRMFIPSFLYENPYMDEDYANRLRGLGDPDTVEAYLTGDWSAADDLAFPMLKYDIHIIPDEYVPKNWPKDRSYDFGYSAPYAVIWFAESTGESDTIWCAPKGSVVVIGYLYGATKYGTGLKEDVKVTAKKILEYEASRNWKVKAGPADNSIFDRDRGVSIAQQMSTKGVIWYPGNKNPGSRVNGLLAFRDMVRNSYTKDAPGFFITESCKFVLDNLLSLPLEENGEDVDTSADDHIWDALRYRVLHKKLSVKFADVEGV